MSLVRLTVVGTDTEAEMLCGLLGTAGISCSYRHTDAGAALGTSSATASPIEVLVEDRDLESARAVIGDQ